MRTLKPFRTSGGPGGGPPGQSVRVQRTRAVDTASGGTVEPPYGWASWSDCSSIGRPSQRRTCPPCSIGEKHGRKRMATLGAVYDAEPAPRTADAFATWLLH